MAALMIVDSPRPTPFADNEHSLRNQGLFIYMANAGKVPATNISLTATLSKLGLPHFNALSRPQFRRALKERLAPEEVAHPTQGFVTEELHLRVDTDGLTFRTSKISKVSERPFKLLEWRNTTTGSVTVSPGTSALCMLGFQPSTTKEET